MVTGTGELKIIIQNNIIGSVLYLIGYRGPEYIYSFHLLSNIYLTEITSSRQILGEI